MDPVDHYFKLQKDPKMRTFKKPGKISEKKSGSSDSSRAKKKIKIV